MQNIFQMKDKKGESMAPEVKTPIVQELLKQMEDSLSKFPPQKVNRWYHRLAVVCEHLVNLLMQIRRPISGIGFLRRSLLAVQSHPQEFTAIHTQLARLSHKAKCY